MFTSHHHPAPTPPLIASSGPASSTSRSARHRTLSVLRSVTNRVTTVAATSQSSSPPLPSALTSASSHDSADPTPPSPGHASPRSIWPHSPIRRSLSYTPAAVTSPVASPGARDSLSEEGLGRQKTRVLAPAFCPEPDSAAATSSSSSPSSPLPVQQQYQLSEDPQPGLSSSSLELAVVATTLDAMAVTLDAEAAAASVAATSALPIPSSSQNPAATLPSIRFTSYNDPRSQRPSLAFTNTTRILPCGTEVIRVGRYSERDGHANNAGSDRIPNASPVGFKSKVVSRRHCEFWFENSKWYIKDVKSSSGTFLNHIRLSPPNTESKPYVVSDGDIVQLGIDFKGGEEMIFRCVKIRLELNRGWASKPSNFNLASHKRLRSLVSQGSSNSQDCSICLNSIAPCQSLFVAPCSHTWHYKCIRSLLDTPQYPYFQCPNCRASADLEAEVEEPDEDWERLSDAAEAMPDADSEGKGKETQLPLVAASVDIDAVGATATVVNQADDVVMSDHSGLFPSSPQMSADVSARTSSQADLDAPSAFRAPPDDRPEWARPIVASSYSAPLALSPSSPAPAMGIHPPPRRERTPSPTNMPGAHDGPTTPRNDAGPFVMDGLANRSTVRHGSQYSSAHESDANSGSIDGVMGSNGGK